MTTSPIELYTNSTSFSILEGVKIPPLDSEDAKAVLEANSELGDISVKQLSQDLFNTVQQAEKATPKTTSLQPICEAIQIAGGVNPQQQEINAQSRVIESGVRDAKDRVDTQTPLTEREDQALPESLKTGFDKVEQIAQRALESSALFLQRQGSLTLSSNVGVNISSLQGLNVSGANTFIGTATTILNNQLTSIASETTLTMSDLSINRVNGSMFTHVEDSTQLSTRNNITRATETNQVVATRAMTHGVELNSNTGDTMISTAGGGGYTTHSTGPVSTYSESPVITLSSQQITMGAGSASSDALPQADGEATPSNIEELLNAASQTASFIRMIADGESPGITSVTGGDHSTVARGNSMTASSGSYSTSSNESVQVAGRQLMNGVMTVAGTPLAHYFAQGKMMITGRMIGGFPTIPMDAVVFPTAPPLPPKPSGYSVEDLEKCIPKKDKQKSGKTGDKKTIDKEVSAVARALGIDPEQIRESAGSLARPRGEAGVEPGSTATPQNLNNRQDKTPEPPSNQAPTASSNGGISRLTIGTGSLGGDPGVYIDRYGEAPKSSIPDQGNIPSLSQEELSDRVREMTSPNGVLTNIAQGASKVEQRLAESYYQELYELSDRVVEQARKSSSVDEIYNTITKTLEGNLRLAYEDRATRTSIGSLIRRAVEFHYHNYGTVIQSTARGGFISDVSSLVQDNAAGALGYVQTAEDIASALGITIPGIGVIGNVIKQGLGISDVIEDITTNQRKPLDFATSITAGARIAEELGIGSGTGNARSLAEFLQENPDSNIWMVARHSSITNAVSDALGSDFASAIGPITDVLERLSSGRRIEGEAREELANSIEQALRAAGLSDIADRGSSVYESLETIISDIELGREISLDDPRVASAIDGVLGGNVASSILSSYNEVKSVIGNVKALTAIPQLLKLMDEQEVPLLAQMSLLVSCLDVFNRVKQIIGSVDNIVEEVSSIGLGGDGEEDDNSPFDTSNVSTNRDVLRYRRRANWNPSTPPDLIRVIDNEEPNTILLTNGRVVTGEIEIVPFSETKDDTINLYKNPRVLETIDRPTLDGSPEQPNPIKPIVPSITVTPGEVDSIWKGGVKLWGRSDDTGVVEGRDGLLRLEPNHYTQPVSSGLNTSLPYTPSIREPRSTNNARAAYLFEHIPYLTQFIRAIDKASPLEIQLVRTMNREAGEDIEYLRTKSEPLPATTATCLEVPTLTLEESRVEVLAIEGSYIVFRPSIQLPIEKSPGLNQVIQVCMKDFVRSNNGVFLRSLQTNEQYTPCIFTYRVIEYHSDHRLGKAVIDGPTNSLVLEGVDNVLYRYTIRDVGTRLIPKIERAYLIL